MVVLLLAATVTGIPLLPDGHHLNTTGLHGRAVTAADTEQDPDAQVTRPGHTGSGTPQLQAHREAV
ncbi:hypothetical protein ABT237_37635 [Streptomyces sp. NPDC001581]|uniref:hypothetical protein n=1 Tax=Streptomyces sp. NPDC001581 TaxID=3154386 RepID=UPI00332A1E57